MADFFLPKNSKVQKGKAHASTTGGATTKFKVMDLDFGGCLSDRKQLQERAKAALKEKVRSEHRERFDALMARGALAVIARATTKRAYNTGDIWTAPVLITIADKHTRWEAEDILRNSKVYPSFHWPKDMVEPVKILRKTLLDSGVDDKTHYIRIRPEERDGRWSIRADTKPKEGNARFMRKAWWPVPAADTDIRNQDKNWAKPNFIKPATALAAAGFTNNVIENL